MTRSSITFTSFGPC